MKLSAITKRAFKAVGMAAALWTASAHAQEIATIDPLPLTPDAGPALTLKVTHPVAGKKLPLILFSHGGGLSRSAYIPLVNQLARNGFAVVLVDHPDSLNVIGDGPMPAPITFWKKRGIEVDQLIHHAAPLLQRQPQLKGRIDTKRIILMGHSYGGHSVQIASGATVRGHPVPELAHDHSRLIKASVLLAPPGNIEGVYAARRTSLPYLDLDRSAMRVPTLVVTGDQDGRGAMAQTGAIWHEDPYLLAPKEQPICIVRRAISGHYLGGIDGWDRASAEERASNEATRVGDIVVTYLKAQLYPKRQKWSASDMGATCK